MTPTTIISTPRGPESYPYNLAIVDVMAVAINNGWRLAVRGGLIEMVEA